MSDAVVIGMYVLTLLPFLSSAVLYGARSPWRQHPVGKVLVGLLASICSVLIFGIVVRALRADGTTVAVLRAAFLGVVAFYGWALFRQIARIQRHQPDACPRRRSTDL